MTHPIRISIVTPSYNQAGFIAEAIDSVKIQQYPLVDHVIMDNCSTDATASVLARYSGLSVTVEKDKGQSDALNKGFLQAKGEIIGWLNADDRYLPGCFQAVVDYFNAHPDIDIVYGNYRLINQQGELLSNRQELPFDLFMLKYLHVLYIPSTTTFFRRKIFDQGHLLDISYHYAMDYEYFLRLALKGYRYGYIPQYLADFRTHPQSKSQQQTQVQINEMEKALLVHDKFLSSLSNPIRTMTRRGLMALARAKRYGLKFVNGAYFS